MPRNAKCEPGCGCGRHNRVAMPLEERHRRNAEQKRARRAADPEGTREYDRSRDRSDYERERSKRRRESDPEYREYHREYAKAWHEANPGKHAEYSHRHRTANPGKAKAAKKKYRDSNLTRIRTEDADYKWLQVHGPGVFAWWAQAWDAQGGRCCYCQIPLPADRRKSAIDHDHTCSCGPKRTCQSCRRGIACNPCNLVIGLVFEDWDRLDRIAAAGRVLGPAARERIAGLPVQEVLPIDIKRAGRQQATG